METRALLLPICVIGCGIGGSGRRVGSSRRIVRRACAVGPVSGDSVTHISGTILNRTAQIIRCTFHISGHGTVGIVPGCVVRCVVIIIITGTIIANDAVTIAIHKAGAAASGIGGICSRRGCTICGGIRCC